MRFLERRGFLNRALEFLPTDRQLAERRTQGRGDGSELAVLLSYTKIVMKRELLASDLPEDVPADRARRVLPAPAARAVRRADCRSSAAAEIITTCVVNNIVNNAGTTFRSALRRNRRDDR